MQAALLDRRRYIGGSDIAAVLGLSPWATPLQLYERKIATEPPPPVEPAKQRFFNRRKKQEAFIASMLEEEYGLIVERLSMDDNPNRYLDAEFDFMAAEIDFEWRMTPAVRAHFEERAEDFGQIPDGTLCNGEIKTVHPFKATEWGEQGSEEVPTHYAAQVMFGLGVTPERPAALTVALFGLDTLMAFPVMRDEETIAALRKAAFDFWVKNVLARVPPEPHNMEELKRVYTGHLGVPVELSDKQYDLFQRMMDASKQVNKWEKDIEAAKFHLALDVAKQYDLPLDADGKPIANAGDNALLYYRGAVVGTWKRQRGQYLDQKRIRAEHTQIVEGYDVEHFFRVFRKKAAK